MKYIGIENIISFKKQNTVIKNIITYMNIRICNILENVKAYMEVNYITKHNSI